MEVKVQKNVLVIGTASISLTVKSFKGSLDNAHAVFSVDSFIL